MGENSHTFYLGPGFGDTEVNLYKHRTLGDDLPPEDVLKKLKGKKPIAIIRPSIGKGYAVSSPNRKNCHQVVDDKCLVAQTAFEAARIVAKKMAANLPLVNLVENSEKSA